MANDSKGSGMSFTYIKGALKGWMIKAETIHPVCPCHQYCFMRNVLVVFKWSLQWFPAIDIIGPLSIKWYLKVSYVHVFHLFSTCGNYSFMNSWHSWSLFKWHSVFSMIYSVPFGHQLIGNLGCPTAYIFQPFLSFRFG